MFQRSTRTAYSPPNQTPQQPDKNQTPSTTIGDDSVYQCELCLVTDNADKVCCDACNLWTHFKCANVTSDVANREWFCKKCLEKKQEPLIDINSDVQGASATNIFVKPSETNLNITSGGVHIPVSVNTSGTVIDQQTLDNSHQSHSRSHKAKSLKSTTSTSSRRKALAIQRLEEEQQLQRLRDQEERERREEERKQRASRDKEYLDKKYSILDAESDASLSYDDYDDVLNPNPLDEVRRWAETTSRQEIPSKYKFEDFFTGKVSRIVPQLSSTNVFRRKNYQAGSQMDEPITVFDDDKFGGNLGRSQTRSMNTNTRLTNDPIFEPLVNNQTMSANNDMWHPPGNANVQSSQTNNVLPVTSTESQTQSNVYSNASNSQLFVQSSTSQADQVYLGRQTLGQPLSSINDATSRPNNSLTITPQVLVQPPTSNSQTYAQTVACNSRQTNTMSARSNIHPTSINSQTLNPNGNLASHIVYSAAYPPESTGNTTFIVNNQPPRLTFTGSFQPSFNTLGTNQSSTASYQQTTSQISSALNYQPVMASYQQPTSVQMPFVSTYQQPIVSHQLSNQQPVSSMQQSGFQNPYSGHSNPPPMSNYQPFVSSSIPPQSGITSNQFGMLNSSSIPVLSGYQPNQNFNSTISMNPIPVNSSVLAGNTSLNYQMNQSTGIRQLTAEQIAARQVIPKELPTFYGDPEDWQTFFSAYENSTTVCGYNNFENLGRIQKSLKGEAYEAVRSLLVHANSVPEVMQTLFMMYGRPELIIETMIQEIRKEPAPKDDDLVSIMKFAIKVRNLSGTIRNTGALEHLRSPTLINSITDKLPTQIQLNWAYYKRSIGVTDLATLGDWLNQTAEAASLVVRRSGKTSARKREQDKRDQDKKDQRKDNNHSNSNSSKSGNYVNTQVENTSTNTDQSSAAQTKRCPACKNSSCNKLASCTKFKQLNRNDRSFIVKENKLCTRCLGAHHFYRCRSNMECKVNDCKAKHHTLLHNHDKPLQSQSKNEKSSPSNDTNNSSKKFNSNASHANVAVSSRNNRTDIFRIVPVTLYHKNRSIQTYVYLDDGSNMTTMETSLAKELNLNGTSSPMCVDWAFGYTHTVESKIVSVRIAGNFDKAVQYELDNVRTVKELRLPSQSITQQFIDQYQHLRGLPISTYESIKPRMLIGLQYSRLTASLKTVEGNENEPLACKTRLGWVLQGPSYDNGGVNRKYSMNICECQSHDVTLHQLVKEYFSTENLGVKVTDTLLESKEIQRARQIMEKSTSKVDGRYETGLLWKNDRIELPDSYPMALKRLQCLESKLAKDPKLADNIRNQIQQFVEKKYIRKLRPEELETKDNTPVWYLPTFPAFNPKKPEKVRIVWDGAAKVRNVSLNSVLLTGPDQLVPLPDILRRFRERRYAMIGDIKEMYHQIKVIKADQNVQRFLWRDGDSSRKPDVYVMMVVTFGLTCSPSQPQFIKNKNAIEFVKEYPESVNTIINNHYVDDMLDCEHTLEAAEKRIKEVKYIHKEGGFEIRNFLSNSEELLKRIGENIDHQSKNMNITVELGTERVLGMFWDTATDCFTFSLKYTKINEKILSGKEYPTKREVLRVLMSVFDPLGLLANYLIYTKILLQEIWRSQIEWDDRVTQQVFEKWATWIKTLPKVENLQIPRLYSTKLSPNTPKSVQLHIFVDASSEAYATAIYYRIEDDDGVDCCLVGAKTKVAPNKPMSIPRLELQGGVLGTRLASSIKSSQTLKIDKQVFWTDSQTVMGWINSEARRYNQFVAFRIGEILEASDSNEWRWIPSEHNVADEATKSKEIAKLNSSSRWYKAPQFLYDKEESWFNNEGDIEFFTDEEVRPRFTMAVREIIQPQLVDIERFSNWNRLLRAQAYVFRFIYNVRHKERQRGALSQQELQNAENHLYRRAQSDWFLDEIVIMRHNRKSTLEKQKEFEKTSILRTYSPYLDEQDVIRMKGRTDNASVLCDETKRPVILPRKHRITKLIVDYYHRRYKHINHSTALNEIHQKFAIPALRVVMKGIRTSCQKCKNLAAEPKFPEMAELPPSRLAAYTLPFTYVGIDYFGPLRVRNGGRRTRNRPVILEKRWILLFTCLTTRAIWMEIAHSLDTNSCIMSIENFILRKGQPREIYSDNGSSFHSSDKELSSEFEKMNQKEIEEKFNNSEMVWKFNPPATPHMGGVWERLVRTVKSCLKQTMLTRTPTDEMLKNLIVSAENIVNSRPLTYVSLESADEEALTPNHILLGSSNGRKPLADITEKDLARNTYKAVQVLANNFWRRFVLEYMPTLTKRTKWFKQVAPIKVGDIVVVVDERNERNTWPKGIVEELIPGKKGIIRQVMVRTAKGIRRRSVGKLAILDVKSPTEEVNQHPMAPVNGEGNVGQHLLDVNADHSATALPDDN